MAGLPEAKILQSIPGVGPVYSAGIVAEIGSISRFNDEAKLAKYAGLAWRQKESGDFNSEHTPRLRTGNTYLRYYLVEAANLIRLRDPVLPGITGKNMTKLLFLRINALASYVQENYPGPFSLCSKMVKYIKHRGEKLV